LSFVLFVFTGEQAEQNAALFRGGEMLPPAAGAQKKRTLEDLFRPPIDLIHKGSFESVGLSHTLYFSFIILVLIVG
jgi:hypothetical protein